MARIPTYGLDNLSDNSGSVFAQFLSGLECLAWQSRNADFNLIINVKNMNESQQRKLRIFGVICRFLKNVHKVY